MRIRLTHFADKIHAVVLLLYKRPRPVNELSSKRGTICLQAVAKGYVFLIRGFLNKACLCWRAIFLFKNKEYSRYHEEYTHTRPEKPGNLSDDDAVWRDGRSVTTDSQ